MYRYFVLFRSAGFSAKFPQWAASGASILHYRKLMVFKPVIVGNCRLLGGKLTKWQIIKILTTLSLPSHYYDYWGICYIWSLTHIGWCHRTMSVFDSAWFITIIGAKLVNLSSLDLCSAHRFLCSNLSWLSLASLSLFFFVRSQHIDSSPDVAYWRE